LLTASPLDGELASFLSIPENRLITKIQYPSGFLRFPYLVVPVYNCETVRKARFNFQAWAVHCASNCGSGNFCFQPHAFSGCRFQRALVGRISAATTAGRTVPSPPIYVLFEP
jgi:predicted PhzF superfamily epimerase YddE/YHI9